MNRRSSALGLLSFSLACGAFAVGCSVSSGNGTPGAHSETTGGVVMSLSGTPADVLCVEIDTSDYRTPQVRVDVTPGGTETVRISPLDPGDVWLSGQAYNQPCESLYTYSPDGGPGGASVTWVADQTYVSIIAGQDTQAELAFHQLGSVDVTVTFDTCDGGGGNFYYCGGEDAGPYPPFDGGPFNPDGGPIEVDGGPPPPDDACGDESSCAMACPPGSTSLTQVDANGCGFCTCEPSMDAGEATPMAHRR